ncbi:helix-turn-helix domain-containing protein [Flammeovirga kamogawensis]|uniref:Helix-turn-helix transcriptional regulator n=1 Tax=Flammeovirga kamogawensis TaxID=373891 RepID=A0ABX8H024_9BACT|nr:AraC family transcriptional regulator [Flammeovirga kamogawensis]MBB6459450.1 AraC-like DNA-binding protein [Flammeovirga kamogawensis]QWG09003.1 helix-turn-helix transcriptional regulator [Flammeovirga kamogawensis]TRX67291.1 helix-turn-helix transcriptional regulator [Flammeovirga kamogawensis]
MNSSQIHTIKDIVNLYKNTYQAQKISETHFIVDNKKAKGHIFPIELEKGLFAFVMNIKFNDEIHVIYQYDEIENYHFRGGVFLSQNFSNITKDKFFKKKENFNDNGFYISSVASNINHKIQKGNEGFRIFYFFSKEVVEKYVNNDVKNYFFKNNSFYNFFDGFKDLPLYKNILKELFSYPEARRETALKMHAHSSFLMMLNNLSSMFESHKYDLSAFHVDPNLLETLHQVKDEILLDFSTKPNIEEISKRHGIHLNKFEEAFQAVFGFTIYNFYLNKRIEFAEHLLVSEHYSIKEIAYDLGFSDTPHFSRSFKKQFSKTPSQYLKEYKYRK